MSYAVRLQLVHLPNDEDPIEYLGEIVEETAWSYSTGTRGFGVEQATDVYAALNRKFENLQWE